MNVVVTGASGFVGRELVQWLSMCGHTGLAVSRTSQTVDCTGWRWASREVVLKALEVCERIDCLIHLEVKQHVDSPSASDMLEFQTVNVDGVRQWLEWCSRTGVERVIHLSSIKAVGDSELAQDETSDSQPTTLYGASKREAENIVRAWAGAKPGRTAVVLRPAVIYGPGTTANVFAMLKSIDHRHFFLIGNGATIKSLVSVKNVVAAVEYLMMRANAGFEVYNVVDHDIYSVRAIASMLAKYLGRRDWFPSLPLLVARAAVAMGEIASRLVGIKFPLTRSRLSALIQTTKFSSAKLISAGFEHPQSTEDGMRCMVDWYRRQQSLSRASGRKIYQ
jgi:UDP-glucose 4-epimerase